MTVNRVTPLAGRQTDLGGRCMSTAEMRCGIVKELATIESIECVKEGNQPKRFPGSE